MLVDAGFLAGTDVCLFAAFVGNNNNGCCCCCHRCCWYRHPQRSSLAGNVCLHCRIPDRLWPHHLAHDFRGIPPIRPGKSGRTGRPDQLCPECTGAVSGPRSARHHRHVQDLCGVWCRVRLFDTLCEKQCPGNQGIDPGGNRRTAGNAGKRGSSSSTGGDDDDDDKTPPGGKPATIEAELALPEQGGLWQRRCLGSTGRGYCRERRTDTISSRRCWFLCLVVIGLGWGVTTTMTTIRFFIVWRG
mmetsp:Transcript_5940/g.12897  ORF Transcript_5940/g.12897 Transcript_5940/m.12897 type:complete len:244 (-) Transcript_5940:198-929(-)